MLGQRAANCLRPRTDLQADLYQRQPAVVEVGCFVNAGRVESSTADRDLPPRQMLRDRPAVDAEQRGQLNERRAVAVPRHQLVDLLGPKKGLSHPK